MPFRQDVVIASELATDVPPNERIEITSVPAGQIAFFTGDPAEGFNARIIVNEVPDDHVTANRRIGLSLMGPGWNATSTGHGTIEIDGPAADGSVPTEIYLLPHAGGVTGSDWLVMRDATGAPATTLGFYTETVGKAEVRAARGVTLRTSLGDIDLSAPSGKVTVSSGGVGTGDLDTGRIDYGAGLLTMAHFTFTLDGSGNATVAGAFPAGVSPVQVDAFWFDGFGQHRPLTVVAAAGLSGQVQVSSGGVAGSPGASGEGYIVYK